MRSIKFILMVLLLCPAADVLAQAKDAEEQKAPPVNQKDKEGKRQGMWVLRQAAVMGEEPFTEFGNYDHGLKFGPWYKIDPEGELISMETYRNNIKDGEAKYFESGRLIATGAFRGLNPDRALDTFVVEDPLTGEQSLRTVSTDRGSVRHGMWRFYDARTGRLMKEEDYQVDEIVYQKDFPMSSADSVYYQKREAAMPHNKKANYYKPPSAKQFGY